MIFNLAKAFVNASGLLSQVGVGNCACAVGMPIIATKQVVATTNDRAALLLDASVERNIFLVD